MTQCGSGQKPCSKIGVVRTRATIAYNGKCWTYDRPLIVPTITDCVIFANFVCRSLGKENIGVHSFCPFKCLKTSAARNGNWCEGSGPEIVAPLQIHSPHLLVSLLDSAQKVQQFHRALDAAVILCEQIDFRQFALDELHVGQAGGLHT